MLDFQTKDQIDALVCFSLISPQINIDVKVRISPSCMTGNIFRTNAAATGEGGYGFIFKVDAGTCLIGSRVLLQNAQ